MEQQKRKPRNRAKLYMGIYDTILCLDKTVSQISGEMIWVIQ